jgi:hypothetical protein
MRDKKRLLAHIGGVVVVVLVLAYIGNRPGHIPMYDANLTRLAETERQGYCAGEVGWKTSFVGDADQAAACRAEHTEQSGRVSVAATLNGFCQAILDQGWDGYMEDCLGIMADNQYWPTYDGSLTDQWNRARPYPSTGLSGSTEAPDGSRTGGRSDGGRSDTPARPGGYPTYGGP